MCRCERVGFLTEGSVGSVFRWFGAGTSRLRVAGDFGFVNPRGPSEIVTRITREQFPQSFDAAGRPEGDSLQTGTVPVRIAAYAQG
jgi:hypothetical protein